MSVSVCLCVRVNDCLVYLSDATATIFFSRPFFSPPVHQFLPHPPTTLFSLLDVIFEGKVHPARAILTGGRHCVAHLAWGTSMKPFYRDSLVDLRRVLYRVLHHLLRSSALIPSMPASALLQFGNDSLTSSSSSSSSSTSFSDLSSSSSSSFAKPRQPRVIIVTRNTTRPANDASRRLTADSERRLVQAFHRLGIEAVICCDFNYVRSVTDVLSYFGHADICIGIHGAGLSNCILSKEKMVLLELQVHHAFGFDSFMKLAHMASGTYLFYDTRPLPRQKRPHRDVGIVLDDVTVSDLVSLALHTYYQSHGGS